MDFIILDKGIVFLILKELELDLVVYLKYIYEKETEACNLTHLSFLVLLKAQQWFAEAATTFSVTKILFKFLNDPPKMF